jgi:signal transduction histidine kinase
MAEAVELMEQTVGSLLLLAREPAAAPAAPPAAPVALLPLIERWVLAHTVWLDERGVELDLRLAPGDTLRLPEPVLRIVLATLLTNALAHGVPNSVVRIEMAAGRLCIGNPSAELPAGLGTAFVKGQGSSGSGLGLAIARRLLERHGGTLAINHTDGQTVVAIGDTAGAGGAP